MNVESPIDLQEAAKYLRMSPSALREKAKAGIIPGFKPGKRWLFMASELNAWLLSNMSPKVDGHPSVGGRTRQIVRKPSVPLSTSRVSRDYEKALGLD